MRHPFILALATIGLSLLVAAEAAAGEARIPAMLSPKLQSALEGRVAGKPVDCISLPRQTSSSIVDETAVIYKASSRRWYVNFPNGGDCPGLAPQRTIITRTPGTRLCSIDLIRVVDLPNGFEYGSCALGPFVPYTR